MDASSDDAKRRRPAAAGAGAAARHVTNIFRIPIVGLVGAGRDDFGGHARRNEFTVGGKSLIGYAGTQSIDTPSQYSRVAQRLLRELGIDTKALEKLKVHSVFAPGSYFCDTAMDFPVSMGG